MPTINSVIRESLENIRLRSNYLVNLDGFRLADYASMAKVDVARTDEDYKISPFNSVITWRELEVFQEKHAIVIPEEYSAFLNLIGNGGLGPYHGLWKFSEAVAHLTNGVRPFPYSKEDAKLYREQRKLAWPDPIPVPFTNLDTSGVLFLNEYLSPLQSRIGRHALVINGEASGTVWFLQDDSYYEPVYYDEKHMSFLDYYEHWLSQKIIEYDAQR